MANSFTDFSLESLTKPWFGIPEARRGYSLQGKERRSNTRAGTWTKCCCGAANAISLFCPPQTHASFVQCYSMVPARASTAKLPRLIGSAWTLPCPAPCIATLDKPTANGYMTTISFSNLPVTWLISSKKCWEGSFFSSAGWRASQLCYQNLLGQTIHGTNRRASPENMQAKY